MQTFAIPFPRFSGQEFLIFRYSEKELVEGIYSSPNLKIIPVPGRIQPITDVSNIKSKFGDQVKAAIQVSTPAEYKIFVEIENRENDYIYYRKRFWKVESAIEYDNLIPHNEAMAVHIPKPAEELSDLSEAAEALLQRLSLLLLNDYDILELENGDLLTLQGV